jgi:two-component system LytT family response regulator
MNTLRAIIVDDESKGAETLKLLLKEHCPYVQLIEIAYSADEGAKKIKAGAPDLVFLDIQMPFADGFSMLEKIGHINFEIIFTTAHNDYAVRAFKHNAIDYLLKPIKPAELINAVNRCREKLSQSAHLNKLKKQLSFFKEALVIHKMPIHTQTDMLLIDLQDIIRFEADGNYTTIFLENGKKITSTKSLAEYEKTVPEGIFLRIHKKNLINRSHINTFKKVEGLIIMVDGSILEVSRLKKAYVLSVLAG